LGVRGQVARREIFLHPSWRLRWNPLGKALGAFANARGSNPFGEVSPQIPYRISELFIMLHDPFGHVLWLFRDVGDLFRYNARQVRLILGQLVAKGGQFHQDWFKVVVLHKAQAVVAIR